jgi:hypothetical protein
MRERIARIFRTPPQRIGEDATRRPKAAVETPTREGLVNPPYRSWSETADKLTRSPVTVVDDSFQERIIILGRWKV